MAHVQTAIFLDRDGTIIVDKHYLKDPDGVELLPGTREGIANMRRNGALLFLLSNQSGISRGLLTHSDVDMCNKRMEMLLTGGESIFKEVCIAPEMPDEPSVYRKPSPKFILECVQKYHLDKKHCYMVGDKESDILAGINAGINSVLISQDEKFSAEILEKYPTVTHFKNLEQFSNSVFHQLDK